jgi:hypothetical protein
MSTSKGYYEKYTLDELLEKNTFLKNFITASKVDQTIEENLKNEDDKLRSKTWTKAYQMAAYYYDIPDSRDRTIMRNRLRYHFRDLLAETENPSELPDVTNRNHLINWVCQKHNQFLSNKSNEVRVECDVGNLLNLYGPDYHSVQKLIGTRQFRL